MAATRIDGKAVAEDVRAEVARGADRLADEAGRPPGLAAVLVGSDPASEVYVEKKDEAAAEAGFHSVTRRVPGDASQAEVEEAVAELNADPDIHGIIVQLPLPDGLDPDPVLAAVDPDKDVDGFHPTNQGRLLAGKPRFLPATPRGIVHLLQEHDADPEGRDVTVVGRSRIVGKPLAAYLVSKVDGGNATVTVCHSRTTDLARHTRAADVLVVAAGQPEFVGADMVAEGATVVDVGVNRVDDPDADKGYRLTGDVDTEAVAEKARAVTPVPGGVGPMTIAMLLRNTLDAAQRIEGVGPPA
jgi:methylenetetrahydrofolate dehydrogenase (NADP+)/methenyltetrahydrofolate cyclohydrolase